MCIGNSWFAHFYLFAAVHMLVNIGVLIYVLLLHYGPHTALIHYLNLINLHHRGTLGNVLLFIKLCSIEMNVCMCIL